MTESGNALCRWRHFERERILYGRNKAVSYTHLDVYKRQGVDDAGSWRHGRCVSEIYHRSVQCDAGAGF